MQKGTKGNRKSRKGSGKPPRWLVLSALAASATPMMAGRFVTPAHAQEKGSLPYYESMDRILTARREDLVLAAPLAPNSAPRRAAPTQDLSVRRFDIPAGPLSEALAAFEKMAGVKVQVPEGAAEGVESPGASGLFTIDQALQELLAGTVFTYRFTDARTVSVDVTVVSETIDVTATPAPSSPKYTEPLVDTPQTLTVIPQALIQEQGATTLRDVLRNVSGISIQAGEGGGGQPGDNLSIRGFAARNDLFVDGVRDFGAYTRDPFNTEQVEVAKGPGSVYTGRGSTGGALNLSSKKPQLDGGNAAMLGVGTDSYARGTVDLNHRLGMGEGTALRVNAMWTQGDTPGRDVVTGERWGVAPSLAFGLGTPTRWTLSYSHLAQDNIPEYGLPWVPATNIPLASAGYADKPAPVSFDNFYGLKDRDYEDTVTGLSTGTVEHDFNNSLTLRSLLRHGISTRDSIYTSPRFADSTTTNINRQLQSRDLTDTILAQQNDLTGHFETGNLIHDVAAGIDTPALPLTTPVVKGYEMISGLGNMFDNTIALTRIIMSGLLDEYPGLNLVCPHLGGTLPYIVGRLDHQTQVLKRGPKYLTKAPSAYLKQVYLDIVSPLPLAIRFGYDFMGPDRLLFASDHPWVDPGLIAAGLRSLKLPPDDERKIFSGNAARLFKLA